jgi:O-antigen/teichoic acid export membrane protein
MIKNTFFMTISTFTRLLTGVVLYMVLARAWGVVIFGGFVYLSTATLLLSLVVDYGYAQQVLRDVGREPDRVARIVGQAFAAKVFLATVTIIVSATVASFVLATNLSFWLFLMLLIASIFNSFAEFFNVAFRGLGCFHKETTIVTVSSLVHFTAVVLLVYVAGQGPIGVACGFVFSRGLYLFLSYRTYRREVGHLCRDYFALNDILKSLKSGFSFGADSALTNFYAQVDTLIVNNYLGPAGVGIYQAGLRLMLGANTCSQVLSNVYLPAVSNKINDKIELNRLLCNMYLQMLIIGGGCCALFIVGAKPITAIVYGAKFTELVQLFPYFGLLLLFRYLAAAHGVTLAAVGLQRSRICSLASAIVTLVVSAGFLVPRYDLKGMIISAIFSIAVLDAFYLSILIRNKIPLGFNLRNSISTAVIFEAIWIAFSTH